MDNLLSPEEKRELQLSELEILAELDRLSASHGIRYFLTAGTLLGAVRHGGFIPWDDDIDVVMTRKDYKKLAKIAKTELSPGFFWQDERSDKHYPFAFGKIRLDGTEVCEEILAPVKIHKGRYVDVFPLDACPDKPSLARKMFKLCELYTAVRVAQENPSFHCGYEKRSARLAFSVLRIMPRPFIKCLRRATLAFFAIFSSGRTLATVFGSHGYPRESYSAEWFSESVPLSFEGRDYPAPRDYAALLTNMYGDYMTPPSDSDRTGHFIKGE